MNKRRKLVLALGTSALVAPFGSFAQQRDRVWRVGVLDTTSQAANPVHLEALRKGLRELGYVEGKNLVVDYRSAEGHPDRLAELALELVRAKVDVLVCRGTLATMAAKNATEVIPIVMAAVGAPVESGLVKSLSHPGGNITGQSSFSGDLSAKRIELIRKAVPGVKRIAGLTNLVNPDSAISWKEVEKESQFLGVQVELFDVRRSADLASAFDRATKRGVGALIVVGYSLTQPDQRLIVELAAAHRLPTIYPAREFVEAGGLMSYGVEFDQLYYRAAGFVDKILKGAKAADLPVEQPTKFELVINLKTAKALGLSIPQSLLIIADSVIE